MRKTLLAASLATAAAVAVAAPTIDALGRGHRLLIVSAPSGSPELAAQRIALSRWRRQGRERDVETVYLDGSMVDGASDGAAAIRSRYAIPAEEFGVALVGKDGHVAFRSSKLVSGDDFTKAIDAMPMRRAGRR